MQLKLDGNRSPKKKRFVCAGVWQAQSSGIYSLSIFISAFIAFVLVEYQKVDKRIGKFLVLGIILA